jgi:hypothetical protein
MCCSKGGRAKILSGRCGISFMVGPMRVAAMMTRLDEECVARLFVNWSRQVRLSSVYDVLGLYGIPSGWNHEELRCW